MEASGLSMQTPTGHFMMPSDVSSPHSLCGPQSINGAVSPNSGLPLLLVASLDTTDPRLGISRLNVDTLHLLYSWTCGISDGDLTYRESVEGVEILAYTKGPLQSDFPYENYPRSFPRVDLHLEPITPEEQLTINRINRREMGSVSLARQFPRLAVPRAR